MIAAPTSDDPAPDGKRHHLGFLSFFIPKGEASPGGSEHLWPETAKHLKLHGHRITLYDHYPKTGRPPWAGLGQRHSVAKPKSSALWRRLLGRITSQRGHSALPEDNPRLRQWLLRDRPDLLVINLGGHLQGLREAQAARRSATPYALVIQQVNDIQWPSDGIYDAFVSLYCQAEACLFVSKANQRSVESMLGAELTQARVIHNPCRILGSEAVAWPADESTWRMALPARLDVTDKGQELLFEVLARPHWRQRPLVLDCFGEGRHSRALQNRRLQLNLEDKVRFCGHQPDIRQIWASHHLAIFPSRAEGMCLAMLEAMAAGRPVLSTAVAGAPEILRDGENGFLASCACADAVDEALERAWQKRAQWRQLGAKARIDLESTWPLDSAAALAHVLLEVLATSRKPRVTTPC